MPSGCNMCNNRDSLALVACLFVLFICLLVVIAVLFPRFASGCNNVFFKTRQKYPWANIYGSDTGPPTGHRNSGPSTGRRNNGPSMGRTNNGPSTGRIINGPSTGHMTITGHR